MGLAPILFRSAPFFGFPHPLELPPNFPDQNSSLHFSEARLTPHYPAKSPLSDVLRLVTPGLDEYITEKHSFEISSLLKQWAAKMKLSPSGVSAISTLLHPSLQASSWAPVKETPLRSGPGIGAKHRQFAPRVISGREQFLAEVRTWLGNPVHIPVAEFEITAIEEISNDPLTVHLQIRYDIVSIQNEDSHEERVGLWQTIWSRDEGASWTARRWEATEETITSSMGGGYYDVTSRAFAEVASYKSQMLRGVDHWRTVLDGACGIDVYGNNGVAAGDFDNDGFDDLYVCQPAGLPNRLYRNRGDGTFEDVTEKAGVGVLDGTACALFADFENDGHQDLLVVCGSGPLFFKNRGDGTFSLKRDVFKFAETPQGTFTHAAIADYDGDGFLDIYFCMYSYYLGLDQYHYPAPYFDARNGPANVLMHNEGNGSFSDRTQASGLNADNDRYSFACAWGHASPTGSPDLYVANDFGRPNLYKNNGDGTFTSVSTQAHAADAGAGMSACWSDINNDGKQDIYVANMWSSAGQRVSEQKYFQESASEDIRTLYQKHARGNSLYRNLGDETFQNIGTQAGVEMGRWSWCSDFWDFDHDGYPDLYVANGYISGPPSSDPNAIDLGSFFWRQVVAKSPQDATPSLAYERGWNALNELIRSDYSWSGYERNVLFVNNRDGTFTEASGPLGLDFPEDSRSFVLADLDHDGRLEIVLKSRNAPQLRILHNGMKEIGRSISFRLRGVRSNRDAIGTAITVVVGTLRQTKYLQAGSGFLAQHSKEVFFGLGNPETAIHATVRWPSGVTQSFESLPPDHRIEIAEGSPTFAAKPFTTTALTYTQPAPQPPLEPLPSQVETWLIDPIKAPEFSLPDPSGKTQSLRSSRGSCILLNFWAMTGPHCLDQLRLLHQNRPRFSAAKLQVLSVNVDDANTMQAARSLASKEAFSFPVLFATEEMAGIYNIIYRYMFDRRRDLPLPASFLLDQEGMIVKIYQGIIDPQRVMDDARSIPTTPADRLQRALPLGGTLCQDVFQRNDFTYGVAMFQHGYLDQAAESFQQVVTAKPGDAEGFYNLGTLSLRKNDFPEARKYLEQTLKLRPNYPEAWNNLGMMAAQEGHSDEAIKNFQQSLRLRPGYAIALVNLGNIYRRQGAYDKAQEALAHALELQPDDPEINYSLGMLSAQQNQMERAAGYLQKAISLRPDYPEALNNLGVLHVRQHEYAKAEEQFKTCIQLVPSFDQSYLNLARLYTLQNERERARAVLDELLHLQPQNQAAKQAMQVLQ